MFSVNVFSADSADDSILSRSARDAPRMWINRACSRGPHPPRSTEAHLVVASGHSTGTHRWTFASLGRVRIVVSRTAWSTPHCRACRHGVGPCGGSWSITSQADEPRHGQQSMVQTQLRMERFIPGHHNPTSQPVSQNALISVVRGTSVTNTHHKPVSVSRTGPERDRPKRWGEWPSKPWPDIRFNPGDRYQAAFSAHLRGEGGCHL